MNDYVRRLRRALAGNGGRPIVVGPGRPRIIGPSPSVRVTVPARFAWDEKRWQRHQREGFVEYRGHYRVYHRNDGVWREFDGSIIHEGNMIAAFIADPPVEMKSHPLGPCLQLSNSPWFRLHWAKPPATVDDALIYLERMLDESFNGIRS